jgi:hypothetical protein
MRPSTARPASSGPSQCSSRNGRALTTSSSSSPAYARGTSRRTASCTGARPNSARPHVRRPHAPDSALPSTHAAHRYSIMLAVKLEDLPKKHLPILTGHNHSAAVDHVRAGKGPTSDDEPTSAKILTPMSFRDKTSVGVFGTSRARHALCTPRASCAARASCRSRGRCMSGHCQHVQSPSTKCERPSPSTRRTSAQPRPHMPPFTRHTARTTRSVSSGDPLTYIVLLLRPSAQVGRA